MFDHFGILSIKGLKQTDGECIVNDQIIKFESACIDRLREYFSMNILTILPLRSLLLLNERSSIK